MYFKEGNIIRDPETGFNTLYQVSSVTNMDSKNPEKEIFTFARNKNTGTIDCFDKEATTHEEVVASKTSGFVLETRRKVRGHTETGYTSLIYDEKYNSDYFGSDISRLSAETD